MTEVLRSLETQTHQSQSLLINHNRNSSSNPAVEIVDDDDGCVGEEEEEGELKEGDHKETDQLSALALFVTAFRKYLIACRSESEELCGMEIGWPTNVRHVAHVTFDRFNGFLGLPVEFEPEVPRRAPSASANVFGVSTESMQCSYDNRGNSVPTILILMQKRLYARGGLQSEGIFRINAENSQEEYVRDQLNSGVVPDGVDVHCLAGLIKAWFRELPQGVLDPLDPEQVMQCQSEEEYVQLVKLLPPTEAALLDWAINLMADVVQEENHNKMNARNVAMVFAPNMTNMSDPLTALMYAVQVMNFLKALIVRTLKEREDTLIESGPSPRLEPTDENGHHSAAQPCFQEMNQEKEPAEHVFVEEEPVLDGPLRFEEVTVESEPHNSLEKAFADTNEPLPDSCTSDVGVESAPSTDASETITNAPKTTAQSKTRRSKALQSGSLNLRRGARKANGQVVAQVHELAEKSKSTSIVSRINSRTERVEAWR
ncbi:hypothetical protein Syun_002527 [Stephania yunnanensis]|uniref:Rho GTPase activating protein n=1 Tax=Stephania yunnanensis TaxID=152371 RepID=A0AAP0LHT4_9MAGN